MLLTNKQEEALKIAVSRYKDRMPWTCIAGYAGSGKTTLIKFIIAALDLDPEDVAYVTYTGKAASVLRQKGCPNAVTAHKLLYNTKLMSNGQYFHTPKNKLDHEFKLIVVDEVSMLPKTLWELLLKHKIHILACGDPFQIPPIYQEEDNKVLDNPHIFLDEIVRQAKESDIIRISMDIREGKILKPYLGEDARIYSSAEVNSSMYLWADEIIVGTNKLRQEINNGIRSMLNYDKFPQEGDKIICLKNSWNYVSEFGEEALVNGTIGYLQDANPLKKIYRMGGINSKEIEFLLVDIETDNDNFISIPVDLTALTTGKKSFTSQEEFYIYKDKRNSFPPPIEFNYGYAITCHRAQGSQWDKVLVQEERFPFDKEEHARWLYTAVTRAAQKLVLILK